MSTLTAAGLAVVALLVLKGGRAYIEPWKRCACAGRKCMRCRFIGKRPKLLARVVRREHLKSEGWK